MAALLAGAVLIVPDVVASLACSNKGIRVGGETKDTGDTNTITKQPPTKATGSKNVNIHITIGSLISGGFTVKTTNIKEGLSKVHDMVTQVLTGAVNDSQIIAGE